MDHKSTAGTRHDRDTRVKRTRHQLRNALIDLLGENEFPTITARMVTGRAKIGYATFFRHYPDVEALLSDVATAMITDLTPVLMPAAARGDGRDLAASVTGFVAENRATCTALLVGAGERTRRDLLRIAMAAADEVRFPAPPWLPPSLATAHQVSASLTFLAWWVEHDPAMPAEEAAELLYRLVFVPTTVDRMEKTIMAPEHIPRT